VHILINDGAFCAGRKDLRAGSCIKSYEPSYGKRTAGRAGRAGCRPSAATGCGRFGAAEGTRSTDLNGREIGRQRVVRPAGINSANAIWEGQADRVPADCWSSAIFTSSHLARREKHNQRQGEQGYKSET